MHGKTTSACKVLIIDRVRASNAIEIAIVIERPPPLVLGEEKAH
jgi:hypothetical protein